jgi:hypothetical protein
MRDDRTAWMAVLPLAMPQATLTSGVAVAI